MKTGGCGGTAHVQQRLEIDAYKAIGIGEAVHGRVGEIRSCKRSKVRAAVAVFEVAGSERNTYS